MDSSFKLNDKYTNLLSNKNPILASRITNYKQELLSTWNGASARLPSNIRIYSTIDQQQIESILSELIEVFIEKYKNKPESGFENIEYVDLNSKDIEKKLNKLVKLSGMDFSNISKDDFINTTEQFFNDSRKFDSDLNISDIYQALRNVWIMNTVQMYLQDKICLTPSIFAYSLLYPYTDNLNDDNNLSAEKKIEFNNHLKKWLEGIELGPVSGHEEKVKSLVNLIEKQYSRTDNNLVYESLLSIYNAQVKSMELQKNGKEIDIRTIMDVNIEKGGTSVLADGYLIAGHPDLKQEFFCMGFGTFLQLADNLQDLKSDIKDGHNTEFTWAAVNGKIEDYTVKLFNFMDDILERTLGTTEPQLKTVRRFICDNCKLLIIRSVGSSQEYFKAEFVSEMEKRFPVRFKYFDNWKLRLRKEFPDSNLNNFSFEKITNLFSKFK